MRHFLVAILSTISFQATRSQVAPAVTQRSLLTAVFPATDFGPKCVCWATLSPEVRVGEGRINKESAGTTFEEKISTTSLELRGRHSLEPSGRAIPTTSADKRGQTTQWTPIPIRTGRSLETHSTIKHLKGCGRQVGNPRSTNCDEHRRGIELRR